MDTRVMVVSIVAAAVIILSGAYAGKKTQQIAYQVRISHIPMYSIRTHVKAVGSSGSFGEMEVFHGQRANGDRVEVTEPTPYGGYGRQVFLNSQGLVLKVGEKDVSTWGNGKPRSYTPCEAPPSAEERTIMGYRAVRVKESWKLSDHDYWIVPELGCEVVEGIAHFRKDEMETNPGAPDGYTVITPVSVSGTPPPDSLFKTDGLVEGSPAQHYATVGPPKREQERRQREEMETQYWAERHLRETGAAAAK